MKNRKVSEIIVPIATCILGVVLGSIGTDLTNRAQEERLKDQAVRIQQKADQTKRMAFYQQMDLHLDGSYAAFQNQCVARDRLFRLLKEHHDPLPELEYEPLFRKFFTVLNEDEKVLFELIRGITSTSLYKHNNGMLTLIEENPEFKDDLPEFKDLHDHLDLWLSKYSSTVKNREDVCLVYVGVAEEKPFPSTIGDKVKQILNELKQSN